MLASRVRLCFSAILIIAALVGCSGERGSTESLGTAEQQHKAAELLYKQNCKVCHAQGINGAPIVGNKKMWADRLPQGVDVLVKHAVEGYGLMPAKGGKDHLTEAEIRQIVEYYVAMAN
ncbi:cytochrome c5 family protein [Pseudomaricurvus alkylphenolicus]|jgi:cytochrome c5|uniref:c-type cytochrome n=1 Tax=Pseudomaricurvus alkylphenolicus TaxID=1306991 RepID=UPI001421B5AF|nr:c-type cytochrome [Pseudomaricurvus alkylphenolicus]NIB44247.1 cytochrome c5 family protein [Pseudomaricurvus alkylphenolicus]